MKNEERFSNRAGEYAKYRPDYPPELFDHIYGALGAGPTSVFADVGSGTGKLTRFLLERGSTVFAVEPNGEMAAAARRNLGEYTGFRPVEGTAERTGLADGSVDFVTCAQAFHWFDAEACRTEFHRVLCPDGLVLIIYNRFDTGDDPFTAEYERIQYVWSDDSRTVDARKTDNALFARFFREGVFQTVRFPYIHRLDKAGLVGRAQSSSHAPLPGTARFDGMKAELDALFARYSRDGVVETLYRTDLIFGVV